MLLTDASMRSSGAVRNDSVSTSGCFDTKSVGSSINKLKILAPLHGLRSFARFARNQFLWLVTNSKVTEHIVCSLTFRSLLLIRHLQSVRMLCEVSGITVSARRISIVLNLWPDRLSWQKD